MVKKQTCGILKQIEEFDLDKANNKLETEDKCLSNFEEIKFIDLPSEYQYMKKHIDKTIQNVIESGTYLLGPQLELLELNISEFSGQKNCVGVKNATDAISLTLSDIYLTGMKVLLPNFGAYPTAVATSRIVPTEDMVFVDVDKTLTMDYTKLPNIRDGIVIFVSLFGNNGNLEKVSEFCKKNNNILVLDAAQSAGCNGEGLADYTIYSFYPTKPLSSMGDGGMVLSNHNIDSIRSKRFYGLKNDKIKYSFGINSRMDELQASIVNLKLQYFADLLNKRKDICKRYLNIVKGIDWKPNAVFHQFVLLVENRQSVTEMANKSKIPFMIHYPHHVTDFDIYKSSVGFRVNNNVMSIPCHPFLIESQISRIEDFLNSIKSFEII